MTFERPDGRWELRITASAWDAVRDDPTFQMALLLARMVDAIKFGLSGLNMVRGIDSPGADRQRAGLIIYLASTVNELLAFRKQHPGLFGSNSILTHPYSAMDAVSIPDHVKAAMGRLRNQSVFHFDPTVVQAAITHVPSQELVLVSGEGNHTLNLSYDLMDILMLASAFNLGGDLSALRQHANQLMDAALAMATAFVTTADDVVLEALVRYGASTREIRS